MRGWLGGIVHVILRLVIAFPVRQCAHWGPVESNITVLPTFCRQLILTGYRMAELTAAFRSRTVPLQHEFVGVGAPPC